MSISEQLKILAVKLDISISEMARRCDKSPQAFIQKMKREKFTPGELGELAERLGVEYESKFILKNGEKI